MSTTAIAFRTLSKEQASLVALHAPAMAGKLPSQIRKALKATDPTLGGKGLTAVVDAINATYGDANREQALTEAGKAIASGWLAGYHYTKSGGKLVCEFVRPKVTADKFARVAAYAKRNGVDVTADGVRRLTANS